MRAFITLWFVTSLSTPGCALDVAGSVDALDPGALEATDVIEATRRSEPELADYTVDIGDALLAGDLGEYETFVAPAFETAVRTLSNGTQVQIDGGHGYWVMSQLFFRGGLAHEDLAVGAHVELGPRNWGAPPDSLQVGVAGCSGPARGAWTYDGVATRTIIDVEQGTGQGDRILRFVATFQHQGGEQLLEGSFGYAVH